MSVVNLVMLDNCPSFHRWVSLVKGVLGIKKENCTRIIQNLVLDYYSQNADYQGFQHYSGSSIISSAARSRNQ